MNTINLHPAIVHFPIALLLLYGVLEIVRPIARRIAVFDAKVILSVTGALGTLAAIATAPTALFRGVTSLRPMIRLHETFAQSTALLASAIALVYLVGWLDREGWRPIPWLSAWCRKLSNSIWMVIPAIAVIILVSLTGALGGIIAYGPDVDPMTHFVYHLFF